MGSSGCHARLCQERPELQRPISDLARVLRHKLGDARLFVEVQHDPAWPGDAPKSSVMTATHLRWWCQRPTLQHPSSPVLPSGFSCNTRCCVVCRCLATTLPRRKRRKRVPSAGAKGSAIEPRDLSTMLATFLNRTQRSRQKYRASTRNTYNGLAKRTTRCATGRKHLPRLVCSGTRETQIPGA